MLLEEARRLKGKKEPSLQNQKEPSLEDEQEAQAKLNEAIQTLRAAEAHDTLSAQATRKAMYITGLCLLEMGDVEGASKQFLRTHVLYGGTPEGLAADLEQADLLRLAGEHETAMAAYRRVLSAISDAENFFNPWFTLEQLRLRIAAAYQAYLESQMFDLALQLAESAFNAFPRARALEMTAEAYSAWAQWLVAQAEGQSGQTADSLRAEARKRYRLAGRSYWRLAELQLASRQYPDLLWQSAAAYFDGQDYPRAITALRKYLDNELRKRQPQALVRLGEALLAVGQLDKGLDVLRQCAEDYPRDAAAYRARLLAARAFVEQAKFDQAEKLLQENLAGDHLTPASKEWRDSLMALGEVLHAARRYEEAITRLTEAIQRYPGAPHAPVASYLLADCYRRIAQGHRERLLQHSAGNQRPVQPGEIHAMFSKALQTYQQTQETLLRREEASELTPLEKSVLRNTCFALAVML
jgi:TolA-binding protein